jgi:hypothetical protein
MTISLSIKLIFTITLSCITAGCGNITTTSPSMSVPTNMERQTEHAKKLNIKAGSGSFYISPNKTDTIEVFYHKPKNFNPKSRILLVLAGIGRNGDGYRDKWVKKSEQYGVLVLSPSYSHALYPKSHSYNMARMTRRVGILPAVGGGEIIQYETVTDTNKWIFKDFDHIFNLVTEHLGLKQLKYDIFGHSAGAQLVHRLVLFGSTNKVDRVIAANSGWYTTIDKNVKFPYGIKEAPINNVALMNSFAKKLVIFLGELDNKSETKGDLRKEPEINKQGAGRFERGKYFYRTAKLVSKKMNAEFLWKIMTVPDAGHSSKKMSIAAADYLYGDQKQ